MTTARARASARDDPGDLGAIDPTAVAGAAAADPLHTYRRRRDFRHTPEPTGDDVAPSTGSERAARTGPIPRRLGAAREFVVQKHDATRLHYDFRLELDGVLLSWAVPKGPSLDPADKHVAIRTEDHPLAYREFEGAIPKGHYGAGDVIVWDRGWWTPVGDPHQGLQDGKLVFDLDGHKLRGRFELVRIRKPGERTDPWLMFKKRDARARPRAEFDVGVMQPDSVVRSPVRPWIEAQLLAADAPAVWVPRGAQEHNSASPRSGTAAEPPRPAVPRTELPEHLDPALATPAEPGWPRSHDGQWISEVKFDGYRLLARIDADGSVRLHTRNGHDWTARMPELARAIAGLPTRGTWLDGEIVVAGPDGQPSFHALQTAFDRASSAQIRYYLFDLPFEEGVDLRAQPFARRRARLAALFDRALDADPGEASPLRLSAVFDEDPREVLGSACAMGLEGIIAKRIDAPWQSGRSGAWRKLKCRGQQEFVVVGYTDRQGDASASEIGSLLLATRDAGTLVPAGGVGTGWDARTARELKTLLEPLRTPAPAIPGLTAAQARKRWAGATRQIPVWVRPELVVQIAFAGITPDGNVRHARYLGRREDKSAVEVEREMPAQRARPSASAARSSTALRISNPERVIDPSTGLTKLDLVRYCEGIAPWLLPHLKDRPVALVRGPQGVGGQLFFQKHPESMTIAGVRVLDEALSSDGAPMMSIQTAAAIAGAAQMNVIEFHPWNARVPTIETPDRLIFDLDPGQGVSWERVREAAQLTHTMLTELGLKSWLKTSGGKGLHIVVPIAAREPWGWEAVKDFSQRVVQHLARVVPDRFVDKSSPANRVGKVFVDYLRNSRGATTVAPYSARARPGLGVSMPIAWEQLVDVPAADHWTIANARDHLSFLRADPWADFLRCRQSLARADARLRAAAKA